MPRFASRYNLVMNRLDILVPFGLPPSEMAPDLMRQTTAPSLASLISRTKSKARHNFDAFSRALPHEAWLAEQFGLAPNAVADNSPPSASAGMRGFGLAADAGFWFILHPVHLHIARDHLVLTDMRKLALSESEARNLFETAKPLFEETGKTLLYGDAQTWFVRADEWSELRTSTPDAACGHNIDIWMPNGTCEREWRRLLNEVQMAWHAHPVNDRRHESGRDPVNSLWLWGGAPAEMQHRPPPYRRAYNLSGWTRSLARLVPEQYDAASAAQVLSNAAPHALLMLDTLTEPSLSSDWSEWLTRLHGLESGWFSPLINGLREGKLDEVRLICSDGTHLLETTATKNSLKKFWIKPGIAPLFK